MSAGSTLILLDGVYTSMTIHPPSSLNGTDWSHPVTVRAQHDGKVLIQWTTSSPYGPPVYLDGNTYWIIEGINATGSPLNESWSVVEVAHSTHVRIRRIAAWDAYDGNTEIFGAHYVPGGTSGYNGPDADIVFEDVAAWGTARKIYQMSQGGNGVTQRRAWGRWERSTTTGPKMTYTLAYNNYDDVCENCLGQWSGERQPDTYTFVDYVGKPLLETADWLAKYCAAPVGKPFNVQSDGSGYCTYYGHFVEQAYGIFAADAMDPSKVSNLVANARWYGSLAYVLPSDRMAASRGFLVTQLSGAHITNSVSYVAPGVGCTNYSTDYCGGQDKATTNTIHGGINPFGLYTNNSGTATQLTTSNLVGFNGIGAFTQEAENGTGWPIGTYASIRVNDTAAAYANLCHEWVNGVETKMPLWPWQMNQRMLDATTGSGHTPIDITKTVESMFGPIPAACDLRKFNGPTRTIGRTSSLTLCASPGTSWESYDSSVATVKPSKDGSSAVVTAQDKLGPTIIAAGNEQTLIYVTE